MAAADGLDSSAEGAPGAFGANVRAHRTREIHLHDWGEGVIRMGEGIASLEGYGKFVRLLQNARLSYADVFEDGALLVPIGCSTWRLGMWVIFTGRTKSVARYELIRETRHREPRRLGSETHPPVKLSTTSKLSVAVSAGVDIRLLEQLFDHTPDIAFFIKDADGRYVAVNQSLLERHGLRNRSQILGRRPGDVCPGEFGRIPAEQDAAVLRTGLPLIERLELHWYSPNQPVWCLTTKLPIRDAAGVVTGIIGISKDVRTPIPKKEIPAEIAAALSHLEKAFSDPLTPSTLAGVAKLPGARFARIIKRIFGITPSQLIAKTRIAAASRLLSETERTVAEIALGCGFFDHSAFTRAFRAMTGVTPTQFRSNMRGRSGG